MVVAAVRRQHRIGGEEAGGFHVDHERGAGVQRREVAGQHQADLVGEDLLALVVDHAAAVAVAVEAQRQVGARARARARPWRAAWRGLRGWDCSWGRSSRGRSPSRSPRRRPCGAAPRARRRRPCRCRRRRPPSAAGSRRHPRGGVGDVALGHAVDLGHRAAAAASRRRPPSTISFSRPISSGPKVSGGCGAHLHPGPAVLVVAGGDHGHARRVEVELGEIGHRRKRQADVQHLAAGARPGPASGPASSTANRSGSRGRPRCCCWPSSWI